VLRTNAVARGTPLRSKETVDATALTDVKATGAEERFHSTLPIAGSVRSHDDVTFEFDADDLAIITAASSGRVTAACTGRSTAASTGRSTATSTGRSAATSTGRSAAASSGRSAVDHPEDEPLIFRLRDTLGADH
jgi:hypothetical protein